MSTLITQERLREVLSYDPDIGIFKWLIRPNHRPFPPGHIAGTLSCRDGYLRIGIDNKIYLAHRLAWLYMTGKWPTHLLDHRDGYKSNNAFSNLREATKSQNGQNQRKANSQSSSGLIGACRYGDRWVSGIKTNGKRKHIGVYDTAQEAHEAYIAAKRKAHEFCQI